VFRPLKLWLTNTFSLKVSASEEKTAVGLYFADTAKENHKSEVVAWSGKAVTTTVLARKWKLRWETVPLLQYAGTGDQIGYQKELFRKKTFKAVVA